MNLLHSNDENRRQRRGGYTLVEMLISMVLVSALMSAAWGIMSMYNSLLTAGKSRTSQQQLVRSVFQIMNEDLTAVALRPDYEEPASSEHEAMRSVVDLPAAVELIGTSSAVRLTIHRPMPVPTTQLSNTDVISETDTFEEGMGESSVRDGKAPRVAEFQTIIYQLQPFGMGDGTQSLPFGFYRVKTNAAELRAIENQRTENERDAFDDGVEINRKTLEALLFPPPDEAGNEQQAEVADFEPPSFELIPEIVDCEFEYFDGEDWRYSWSKSRSKTLPVAIRITIDVLKQADVQMLQGLQQADGSELKRELGQSFSGVSQQTPVSDSQEDGTDPLDSIRPDSFERVILLNSTLSLKSASTTEGAER